VPVGGWAEGIAESLLVVLLAGRAEPGASAAFLSAGAIRTAAAVFFDASAGTSGRLAMVNFFQDRGSHCPEFGSRLPDTRNKSDGPCVSCVGGAS
jgi:hypothetical protein